MYFKKTFILFLLINSIALGQNYFNRAIGNRVSNNSAKSLSMGGVGFMNNETSSASIINPASLMNNNGWKVDVNYKNNFTSEYRSFPSIDSFENTFSNLTYVYNSNNNSLSNAGIMYVNKRFGFSVSTEPFISTDYHYVEEVRNGDDELEGYYKFETNGTINCNSFGLGIALNKNVYIGSSINQLADESFKTHLDTPSAGISFHSTKTAKKEFISISALVKPTQNTIFAFGFEENTRIEYISSISVGMDDDINLPFYDSTDTLVQNELYKPSYFRFGFIHTSKQIRNHSISFEYEKADYSKFELDSKKLLDVHTLSVGVEYLLYNFPPLRVGLTHNTSPFRSDLSKTIFSVGTGWDYRIASLDVGCRYWNVSYPYPDIFPHENDLSNPFSNDIVKENNLELLISLQIRI